MSYEVLERQIRTLPEEALEDVSIYLDKIGKIYRANKAVDFSFVDDIFGTLSDSEADALRSCCGLTFREDENRRNRGHLHRHRAVARIMELLKKA